MKNPKTQNSTSPISDPSAASSPAAAVGTVAGDVVETVAGVVVVAFREAVTLVENEVKVVERGGPGAKVEVSIAVEVADSVAVLVLVLTAVLVLVLLGKVEAVTVRVRLVLRVVVVVLDTLLLEPEALDSGPPGWT